MFRVPLLRVILLDASFMPTRGMGLGDAITLLVLNRMNRISQLTLHWRINITS